MAVLINTILTFKKQKNKPNNFEFKTQLYWAEKMRTSNEYKISLFTRSGLQSEEKLFC